MLMLMLMCVCVSVCVCGNSRGEAQLLCILHEQLAVLYSRSLSPSMPITNTANRQANKQAQTIKMFIVSLALSLLLFSRSVLTVEQEL